MSRPGGAFGAPELRELRYFAAAARTGNLGRAAQQLNVTASAISQQLHKLEQTLGTPLLLRHGRGVAVTPAGECLLQRIDTIQRLLAAPLTPPAASDALEGTVAVAVPAEISAVVASMLASLMRTRWPHASLELRETTDAGLETLCAGSVDIALLPEPPDLDELYSERLLTDPLGLVVSPRDALADSAEPLRLRDLLAVPLVLPNPRHWIRRLLARAAFQRGLRFDAAAQVDGLPVIRALVRDGQGGTLLPAAAVQEDLARGTLVFRPLEPSVPAITFGIAVGRAAPAPMQAIAAAMGEALRSLAATQAWPSARPVRPAAPLAGMAPMPSAEALPKPWPEPVRAKLAIMEGN